MGSLVELVLWICSVDYLICAAIFSIDSAGSARDNCSAISAAAALGTTAGRGCDPDLKLSSTDLSPTT